MRKSLIKIVLFFTGLLLGAFAVVGKKGAHIQKIAAQSISQLREQEGLLDRLHGEER